MSHRIDFFQSAQTQLAIPAVSVAVLVDGTLCPFLEPREIVYSCWPEFNWSRLVYNSAAHTGAGSVAMEDIEFEYAIGKPISIRQYYNGVPPGAAAFGYPIFSGHIEGTKTRFARSGEAIEIMARDFSANLKRISVYGQHLSVMGDSTLFLAGMNTIFNPDGKANAYPSPAQIDGKSYTTFCAEPSQSKFWSYAEVIDYLLCEYLPSGQLGTPTIGQLKALTDNQTVRDLDITGLNVVEALYRCCDRIGLQFKFVPRPAATGPSEAIMFYKRGAGRVIELNCQRAGEQLSISKTNIAVSYRRKSFWPITHKYIGQGNFRIYEATFNLVKAWDGGLEGDDYDKFSPSTNPDFYQVRDVYRKWCLNEVGDYSGSPYNQGEAFDFSKVFETENFAPHRRRFWPTLTSDKQGKSLGYFLQVSFDSGTTWWQYLHAFNNLLDECGVWLSSDRLDIETWVAALQGTLRFRITASVVSDERLSGTVANGPVNSTAPVVEHLLTLPRQFKYRKISSQSVFAGIQNDTLGAPDEADDSDALYEFVRHWAATSAETIETIDVQTPYLELNYMPGDGVSTNPDSRDILGCRSDNRSRWWVERVQMDFKKQCTNLKIVRQRAGNS